MSRTLEKTGAQPSKRVLESRRRATARQRALSRLAREYAERYRQLYREEVESPCPSVSR